MTNQRTYTIIDAGKDFLLGNLKFATPELAHTRTQICDQCEVQYKPTKMCTACHCVIPIKVKLKESTCPMELW